jgi:glycosyltransferase involved in cell wall biosynthesis
MEAQAIGSGRMRILHVGWGFSPWRAGGLIFYAEDLMAAQVAAAHDVAYFFAGRHYPYLGGPRLRRWRRRGVRMHELINAPIVPGAERGTRHPERELSEPRTEAAFERTVRAFAPDVVHIQELYGLPSSLIDVAAALGAPTVMTLQDYFPLCATLRLVDADGRLCTRLEVGEDCALRNADAPEGPEAEIAATLEFEKARLRRRLRVPERANFRLLAPVVHPLLRRATSAPAATDAVEPTPAAAGPGPAMDPGLAVAFQRRRDVNVERLGRVGRLVAQSPRVAEIYRERGVPGESLRALPFTLSHIARLRPRAVGAPPRPITFATLNGCTSPTKGSALVAGALAALREAGLEGAFRLRVLGKVDRAVRAELERFEGVELAGDYGREQLDELLDDVDVGIMPSLWEEALGYAGVEMVAKGIPLIANPLGGIVEYAREGETAWLNESCSAGGLAGHMAALIAEPERVVEMHRRLLGVRDQIVLPMARHADAIEDVYRELVPAG